MKASRSTHISAFSNSKLLVAFLLVTFLIISIYSESPQPVRSKHGMVVSASTIASKIGVEIMKKGGNAIDAAVAVGFALAVTYPYAGNIGGGGFMVIHLKDGKNLTIDYREKAPLAATRNMYLDKDGNYVAALSQEGTISAGVPGSVAGLLYALNKYGTLKISDVIQPAIDLADNGWMLNYKDIKSFDNYLPEFEKYPSSYKVFTNNGVAYKEGELFTQPDLARTLEQIKENGRDGFYKGSVAELLIKQIQSMGGIITQSDLDEYQPVERKPV